MPNVTRSSASDDPLPPPGTTPYFSRAARYREAFDQAAAGRGLPLPPWAA